MLPLMAPARTRVAVPKSGRRRVKRGDGCDGPASALEALGIVTLVFFVRPSGEDAHDAPWHEECALGRRNRDTTQPQEKIS
jgi:hypothetical protein